MDYRAVITNQTELDLLMRIVEGRGYSATWSGLCLWINAPRSAKALSKLGALWSGKRGAWYIRAKDEFELSPCKATESRVASDLEESVYADEIPF